MAVNLKETVALIKAGQNIDVNTLADINAIHSESEYDFHESSNYENEYQTTTRKTLLHIAIESRNVQVFNALLNAGADPNINVEETESRKQRCLQSGSAFFGPSEWSEWEEWDPTHTTTTTRELAQRIGNQEIITRLNAVLAPGLHP